MTKTETKWTERVAAWRSSGETAPDFARGRGFEASTLRYWASRLDRGARDAGVPEKVRRHVRMVRVTREAAPPQQTREPLVVSVGAVRVEVRPGFDRALLRELVDALGGSR